MTFKPLDEKAIFKVACQITSPQARADYLRQVCGDDEALHDRVAVLLKEHEDHPSFLEVPPAAFSPTLDMPAEPPTREGPGAQIGPFKLLEQIGEGGFGIVYMAEQQHPVRRKVALKVLKPGMDTRQVIARFEAERQALALMDHPHIAKVLDAGATESGRPYFVMELVRGMPITEYCDAHQLTPRERLELFVPVCHAVQHAHQKGIVHRDIKPSNVLVTKHDGMPVVKVIDFGVAKALGQQLTDKTLFTGFAQMIGTPLYMSPEQAELSGLDIDTRTDIYSLGVLLYELLTGTTPFDKERLKSAAFDEIRRMIREEEPPKPSTRLSELSRSDLPSRTSDTEGAASRTGPARQAGPTSLASIAALRKTEPRKLSQLVRGDLDWIVMKALEKDRNRRYETANGFALDIQRYLFDEPVAACPPSAAYRLRKFARRNKGSFAVGATVTVALLVSVVALAVSNALVRKESNEKQMALDAKGRALRDKDEALGEKEKALQQKGQALIDKGNALQTAETERNNAAANAKEAKTQEKLARRRFYAAQMNLAQQALEKGNTARVLELLENHRPRFDEEDLRGFEWYYLWGKCHRGLRTWLKTDSPPTAIAFAPDGRTMAIAGDDREVMLADAESGAAIGRLLLRDGELLKFFWEGGEALMFPFDGKALSFSRNGRELAVATTRGIQLWDWKEQEFLATLGHAVPIAEVVFFPDGKLLASVSSAGRLGRISIWDVEQRELVTTLPATEVWHVAIASDGTRLAAGGNRYVSVWLRDGRSWTKVRTHENLVHEVTSIAFSPDGVLLAAAALDNSADSSQVERIEPIDAGAGAAAAPVAPEKLVSGRPSHSGVYVWDVETGKEWVGLKGRGVVGWIGTIAFTPDSRFLAVSNHRTVLFYDLLSGLPQITTYGSPTHTGTVEHARFSPDGRFLVTAAASENIVKIWDSTAPAAPEILTVAGGSKFVSFSRDEQTLLAGSSIVKFWDLPSGREARSWALEEGESVTSALSSDGRLIATNHPDKTVKVTDVATGAEVARTAPLKRPPAYRVLFSPDVQTLAVAALETLPVWDIPGNKLLFTAPAQHYAYVIAFAPDGKRLGAAMLGGTVNVFDARTGALLKSIAAGSSWTTALAFSPDSRLLATANSDGTLKLWNPDDGTLQGSLRGHGDVVTLVNFFDDGQTVVSGTQDGAVRLWDMTTGQELLTFHDHQSMVNGAVVKRDGSLLATNSVDGQVRLRHALRPSEATAPRTELDPEDPLSPARQLDAADQFWAAGADEQAMAACESARVRLEVLVERFPQVRDYGRELARSWLVASLIEGSPAATGEPGEALRRAVDLYQHVPDGNQKSLVDKYSSLGQSLLARGEHDRPEQLYKHLVAFFEQLATADPNVPQYRLRAAVVEGRLAGLFAEVKQLPEAIAACKRASDLLQALSEDFPAAERGRSELVDAWSRIGSVRRSCQKIPDAVAAYSRTVDVQPDSPNVWWNRAYTYADANEHEKALHDYSKSIELDPSQWAAWNNRGVCYHRLGQMELAAADFSRAAELEPRGATQARQNLARTRVALGQLDLALAEFSRAIDAHPGSAGPLWTERGAIHAHFQRWAEAAADYSKAVELQPNNVPTLMSLVGALFLSGKKDEAVGWYRKVIELDPKDAVTCNNVGGMLLLLGEFDEARPWFEKALNLDPKRALFHRNLGDVQAKQGAAEEAVSSYQRAIELDPKFTAAHSGLGAVFLSQERFDEAVASFKKALELDPRLAAAHNGLGTALFEVGRWDEAAASFRRALELDPNNAAASKSLGDALFQSGRLDEAVAAYRRAIELNPAAWQKLADSFQETGRLAEGEKGFGQFIIACRKLAEANPGSPRLTLELAWLLTFAGRAPETLALWEKQVDPSSSNEDPRLQLGHKLWEVADQLTAASRDNQAENAIRGSLLVFEILAANFPGNAFYRVEQGFTQWKLGSLMTSRNRPQEAEGAFRQALAVYEQLVADDLQNIEYRRRLARSHSELALIFARQGKQVEADVEWDNAIAESTKAIELKPDVWESWSGRAFVHFHRQQWDEAVADFSKAIELAPEVHTNWWHRGHSFLNLKQWDKAAADFGKVVDQWPEGGEGWWWHAVALAELNQPEKAMADLRQAIAKGFQTVDWLKTDTRLDSLRGREDFDALLQEFERKAKAAGK